MIDDFDKKSENLRILVYQALKLYETKPLLNLLFDDHIIIRTAVARELQIRGERMIFNFVKKHLNSKKENEREICVFTLGQLGTPEKPFKAQSLPLLLPLLKDRSTDVRSATASSLGHLCTDGMPEHVEQALVKAAKDKSSEVRECIGCALGSSSGSPEALQALKDLSMDTHKEVRGWAKVGLKLLKERKGPKKKTF